MPTAMLPGNVRSGENLSQIVYGGTTPTVWHNAFLKNGASADMNVDGSSSVVKFKYTVPAGKTFQLSRMNICLVDSSVDPADFGGITGALANGVLIDIYDESDAVVIDLTAGQPIKVNCNWVLYCGVDLLVQDSVVDGLYMRWTFAKAGAAILMPVGYYFQITIQDDLTGLVAFQAQLQGLLMANA